MIDRSNRNEYQKHHAQFKKPDRKDYIVYNSIYIKVKKTEQSLQGARRRKRASSKQAQENFLGHYILYSILCILYSIFYILYSMFYIMIMVVVVTYCLILVKVHLNLYTQNWCFVIYKIYFY